MDLKDEALRYHQEGRPGKIEVTATKPLTTQRHLSLAYTPGVAEACRAIEANPEKVFDYTAKGNLVAVVTNGTAVLGLGNIGPLAGKPVMEGKANLFKKFADIDVFDIELDAKTADEIVAAVKAIAPTFGGINLEDIKAPECFEVERRLQEALDIPVFHDDQHGTAIISSAALINVTHLTERKFADLRVVFSGAGAAAIACAELYVAMGVQRENIVMFDVGGVLTSKRTGLSPDQAAFANDREVRDLEHALVDADVFIGLSVGNILKAEWLKGMAPRPVIFALANPDPEIKYESARQARPDAIIATGRSDFPNQVNNVLGFPFVFRGALDCRARKVTRNMKIAAANAIAGLAREAVPDAVLSAYGLDHLGFGPDYIIPKPFDARVLTRVAPAVAEAASADGVARSPIEDLDAYREKLQRLVDRAQGLMQPLSDRARNSVRKATLVFPDGASVRVLRAVQLLAAEQTCIPVVLGQESRIRALAEANHLHLEGVRFEEVVGSPRGEQLAQELWLSRARKGMTLAAARSRLRQPTWYGAALVKAGLADGMVGGSQRPYKDTLGPALRVLGLEHGHRVASGVYAMLFRDRKIFFGDCTVNIEPDAEALAEIAMNTALVAQTFGEIPRVAMLSYSDFGEHHQDADVVKVRKAIELVQKRWPKLEIDGEMQADTAVDRVKMENNFPFCALTGPANVLVFPNLTSGNIAYKLLDKLSDAEVLGPLLVGLSGAISVIPIGATVNEIVNIATYTAVKTLPASGPSSGRSLPPPPVD